MGWFKDPNMGRRGDEVYISPDTRKTLTQAQKLGVDAVYHGECHGCLNLKGNSQGDQMRYCLDCAICRWSDHYPNRRLAKSEKDR